MALELKRRRFTVTEYHRMATAGILGEDDRVELINGEIAPSAFPDRPINVADILPAEPE